MKYFYVVVDTNDADYVGKIVKVDGGTFEYFKPLIEKIKNFQPYNVGRWRHTGNFPVGSCLREDLGEKHPMELYDLTQEEYDCFIDTFELYGSEFGFHTIETIQEVNLGEVWL